MTGSTPAQLFRTAQVAMTDGDWVAARAAFESLVRIEPSPEALCGLGDVLWWLGETTAAVDCQQQAYSGFQHRADRLGAGMSAVSLYLTYRVTIGSAGVARGWLARLARLAEETGAAPLIGWLALVRAHDSGDPVVAERWATQAQQTARTIDDADLELCAISQLGAAMTQQGRLDDGVTLLDEAMAAALAGEAHRPHTVVYVSCNLISSCADSAQFDHVLGWIRAADAFGERYGGSHLHTTCRLSLGAIRFATGDWAAAERELREVLDLGPGVEPDLCGEAAARLAELRLAQGRIEEAERLLDGWSDQHACVRMRAWLALAHGDRARARRLARQVAAAWQDTTSAHPYRPGISGPLAEADSCELLAAVGSSVETAAAASRLAQLATTTTCAQLEARALAVSGRAHRDVPDLERAVGLFTGLGMPLAAARVRLALAELLAGDDAIAEARAALDVFCDLGAARDADTAAHRLRELGVTAVRGGPTGPGELTKREREVLILLGEGLTNRQLAERLFLSRKTVERHVRNVLFKLGLRNRAEAAAYAVRHTHEIHSVD